MMIPKQDLAAALAHLAEAFPQTFVLEKHRPHRPLKVGIAADIRARCPAVERRVLSVVLSVYTRRVMYLQSLVAGAARVGLDGKAGEVTATDAEYAAASLAGILASREARRVAAAATNRVARDHERAATAAVSPPPAPPAAATPPAATVLKQRPVLRLPAFRTAAQ